MTRKEYIKKEMGKLQNELDAIEKTESEIERVNYHLNKKHCITCSNRDKKNDFFIPDCIVCLHPSNQNGKNKFQCYTHTCEFWEQES